MKKTNTPLVLLFTLLSLSGCGDDSSEMSSSAAPSGDSYRTQFIAQFCGIATDRYIACASPKPSASDRSRLYDACRADVTQTKLTTEQISQAQGQIASMSCTQLASYFH